MNRFHLLHATEFIYDGPAYEGATEHETDHNGA